MTEPTAPTRAEVSADEIPESVYSKDYWDNVFEQIGRRSGVKLAIAILAVLYALAIYAPVIANDRPYVLVAVDHKEYSTSQKTLYGVAISIRGLAKKGEEAFLSGRKEGDERTFASALDTEAVALREHLDVMRRALPEENTQPLDELQAKLDKVVSLSLAGNMDEATVLADELKVDAKTIRTEFKALDPAKPEKGGMELQPRTSYPLIEATNAVEVFFMWLWALVLLWPLWNKFINRVVLDGERERIRRARKPKLFVVLGTSAIAAVAWGVLVGGSVTFESAPFKQRLTSGELVAERVVFPPLRMGFAENHLFEVLRPPTWHSSSEIDENGYYVRGMWVPTPDPISGEVPPAKPVEVRAGEPERNAMHRYLLGTDTVGRDLLVRILYGGRISLTVGILSTILLVFLGVVFGALAGYLGGWVDIMISRMIEIVQSFPALFLILVVVAVIPDHVLPPMITITVVIALIRWTGISRLVRGEFLRLRDAEFVVAAEALGFSSSRVIFRHILPNALGPVLVAAAFSIAAGILTESTISFLGFGVKHPVPSWGFLLSDARGQFEYWWLQIAPGFLIFLTVFCYNIVGEGVRDALDPRRKA